MKKLMFLILALASGNAIAAPINYTLGNVLFSDGGTAAGTFVRDSVTGVISDVNLYTTVTSAPTSAILYNSNESLFSSGKLWFFTDNYPGEYGETALVLDVGDVAKFSLSQFSVAVTEFYCAEPCTASAGPLRSSQFPYPDWYNGTITAVPIPTAVWLFGSGLGLLAWMRRRQLS